MGVEPSGHTSVLREQDNRVTDGEFVGDCSTISNGANVELFFHFQVED
jgi:hypothetical protein